MYKKQQIRCMRAIIIDLSKNIIFLILRLNLKLSISEASRVLSTSFEIDSKRLCDWFKQLLKLSYKTYQISKFVLTKLTKDHLYLTKNNVHNFQYHFKNFVLL